MLSNQRGPASSNHLRLVMCVIVLATAGCRSDQKKTYPVQGKFVWPDGSSAKELAGGMVIFQCDAEQITSKAIIDQQGGFALGTYKLADGTVAGEHKIAIVQPVSESDNPAPLQVVDRRYEDPNTSDLIVTVEPKSNEVALKVEPGAWMKRRKR